MPGKENKQNRNYLKLFHYYKKKKKKNPKNTTANAFIHVTLSPGIREKTKWVGKKREKTL